MESHVYECLDGCSVLLLLIGDVCVYVPSIVHRPTSTTTMKREEEGREGEERGGGGRRCRGGRAAPIDHFTYIAINIRSHLIILDTWTTCHPPAI